jgi:hypothetical protein
MRWTEIAARKARTVFASTSYFPRGLDERQQHYITGHSQKATPTRAMKAPLKTSP